jgi:hypothetical protein
LRTGNRQGAGYYEEEGRKRKLRRKKNKTLTGIK